MTRRSPPSTRVSASRTPGSPWCTVPTAAAPPISRVSGALQHRPAAPGHRPAHPLQPGPDSPPDSNQPRHRAHPPKTHPERPDQRVHASCLTVQGSPGQQPNPIFERHRVSGGCWTCMRQRLSPSWPMSASDRYESTSALFSVSCSATSSTTGTTAHEPADCLTARTGRLRECGRTWPSRARGPTAFVGRGRGHAGCLDVARTDALTSQELALMMWVIPSYTDFTEHCDGHSAGECECCTSAAGRSP
jgi:hypothetical protein